MRLTSAFHLLSIASLLGLSACSTVPTARVMDVPRQARPEDVAAADEFFSKNNARGLIPPAESMKTLTAAEAGYVVELDQQRVYLFHGGTLLAYSKISRGRPKYRTETGAFVIGQREANHRSNIYGDYVGAKSGSLMMKDVIRGFDPTPAGAKFQGSLMKYFQRFDKAGGGSTAMGFHAGVLPGSPASHGCVRLPESMAKWFFENVPAGTPVYINGVKNGVPLGTKQTPPKRSPKIHPSLKAPEPTAPQSPPAVPEDAAPSAPVDLRSPAPAPAAPENPASPPTTPQ